MMMVVRTETEDSKGDDGAHRVDNGDGGVNRDRRDLDFDFKQVRDLDLDFKRERVIGAIWI